MPAPAPLRQATAADLDALCELHEATLLVAYRHIFPPDRFAFPREATRLEWAATLVDPGCRTVVVDGDGGLDGTVTVRGPRLAHLFVVPQAWGTGTGARLHDHAVAAIRATGAPAAVLSVLDDNRRARRFYERRGWVRGVAGRSEHPPFPVEWTYTLPLAPGATTATVADHG